MARSSVAAVFELALKQQHIAALRRMAKFYNKDVSELQSKDDFVGLLTGTLKLEQKLEALQGSLLAGRTAMALFRFTKQPQAMPQENFKHAGNVPSVVTVGKNGEIVAGLTHLGWAVLDGQNTYLDANLDLQVEPAAAVIDSFYDPACQILQVRAASMTAIRIARAFAELTNLEETHVEPLGLARLEDVDDFVDSLGGGYVKVQGRKKESKGFNRVWADSLPGLPDLRGTEDYDLFVQETEAIGRDVVFAYDGQQVSMTVGITTKSFAFRSAATESTMQYVYGKFKEYFKL